MPFVNFVFLVLSPIYYRLSTYHGWGIRFLKGGIHDLIATSFGELRGFLLVGEIVL